MKQPVYAIRDLKSEFWSPKVAINDDSIRREFAMMVAEPGNFVSSFPDDFELYQIADYDTADGKIVGLKVPRFVCRGSDLKGVINEK